MRFILPYLAFGLLTLVRWTTRLRVFGDHHRQSLRRRGQRFIYAFWHNRQVFFTTSHRGDGLSVLVSQSRDGDIIAKVMELSRIEASRGSSSRGASAGLRDMMAVVERGTDLGITPDGPKGPAREAKPGALYLARKLGVPILPSTNATTRKLVFKRSWDQYQVPLPFARAVIGYGSPIWVREGDDLKAKAAELKASLDEITGRAEREAERGLGFESPLWWAAYRLWSALAPLGALGVLGRFALSRRKGVLSSLFSELPERLGRPSVPAVLAGRPVLWVHAASAGEVNAARPLMERLREGGAAAVVVTSTTAAGRDRARALSCVDAAFCAPIDAAWAVRSFLARVRPYSLVLIETELWPAMIVEAQRAGLRLGLANGRISERAFDRYRAARGLLRPLLTRVERIAAQTHEDSRRFAALGAAPESLGVAGNMKYDLPPAAGSGVDERLSALGWNGKLVFTAGSTHPGEERMVVKAFLAAKWAEPSLRLVLAPRHAERAEEAARLLEELCVPYARWSRGPGGPPADALLVDALGVLPSLYARADVAFVGGTLVPVGGHNLLEPAFAGKPVLFGPHTAHTPETARALVSGGGGWRVGDADQLGARLTRLARSRAERDEAGSLARLTAQVFQGAAARVVDHLQPVLTPP